MLIDLMSTMARLDQAKRVERINEGLKNKKLADPKWKPKGNSKNQTIWDKVLKTMAKHRTMSADEVAKIAECGVATVYRVKRETKQAES